VHKNFHFLGLEIDLLFNRANRAKLMENPLKATGRLQPKDYTTNISAPQLAIRRLPKTILDFARDVEPRILIFC
jgi:hypothetical protein